MKRAITATMALLILAAIILNSWTAVALVVAAAGWSAFDRLFPAKVPDPTGAELLEELRQHREQVERELNDMRGKLQLRSNQRTLRE